MLTAVGKRFGGPAGGTSCTIHRLACSSTSMVVFGRGGEHCDLGFEQMADGENQDFLEVQCEGPVIVLLERHESGVGLAVVHAGLMVHGAVAALAVGCVVGLHAASEEARGGGCDRWEVLGEDLD
jgi:hypothetical protein